MSSFPMISVSLSHLITFLDGRRDWQGLMPAECGKIADQLRPILSNAITFETHYMTTAAAASEATNALKGTVTVTRLGNVIDFPGRSDDGGAA